jgi:hypothetical protein
MRTSMPASSSRFFRSPFVTHTFANEQRFDFESLKGRLLSCSYAPAEGQPKHDGHDRRTPPPL